MVLFRRITYLFVNPKVKFKMVSSVRKVFPLMNLPYSSSLFKTHHSMFGQNMYEPKFSWKSCFKTKTQFLFWRIRYTEAMHWWPYHYIGNPELDFFYFLSSYILFFFLSLIFVGRMQNLCTDDPINILAILSWAPLICFLLLLFWIVILVF